MLVRYNPYRNLVNLPGEVENFFKNCGLNASHTDRTWNPSVDISETEDQYELYAEVPGLAKDDINVNVEDGTLTLSGEKKTDKEEDNKNYHSVERAYGKFERSFRLPKEVRAEDIKARYENGVLRVEIPKAEKPNPNRLPSPEFLHNTLLHQGPCPMAGASSFLDGCHVFLASTRPHESMRQQSVHIVHSVSYIRRIQFYVCIFRLDLIK